MGKVSLYEAISSGSTISGTTLSGLSNIYHFIDESGNVTQIKKNIKNRFKFYIDPEIVFLNIPESCVIGINNAENGDCSFGIGLGIGDNDMVLAKYN